MKLYVASSQPFNVKLANFKQAFMKALDQKEEFELDGSNRYCLQDFIAGYPDIIKGGQHYCCISCHTC